ncbi:ectonucleotide pyrophosphatase/phosphodiesterase [Hyphococcus sp.]|uniref:alkaline phosphatase family protein n=1 Tax=Hyphococcus sp. TaxID=2038636 RepID=UPI002089D4F3|nr:MAG: alkaline phosphatase family protein [Marinicaulis sp.]
MKRCQSLRLLGLLKSAALIAAVVALSACASTLSQSTGRATVPTPSGEQYVILIGLDGLRADAIDRFPDAAPNLSAMAARGVRASGMVPAMPSKTFVNFYTIATGLYPEHTGIVSNSSYSRSLNRVMKRTDHSQSAWWGGEPIWVTAEKQSVKTATMFWLGSEAEIGGVRPSYWLPYEHKKPDHERVAQVLSWLALPEAARPRLVTVYYDHVDTAEHSYGVGSEEERLAIARVDANVGEIVAGVRALGLEDKTNFIVVSDHGMANVPAGNIAYLNDYISLDDVFIPEFEGPDGPGRDPLVHIFVENGDVDGAYEALAEAALSAPFKVYRREHLPERWHMNNPDRTGDIVAVADEGWQLFAKGLTAKYPEAPNGGVHGFDRHLPSMLATFIADGPRFADGVIAEPFDNVEVYGMIAEILGVAPAATDGDLAHVQYFLTRP